MTNIELTLNQLAEVTTTALSRQEQPTTFEESKKIAKRGGNVANNARKDFEKETGLKVTSPLNASNKKLLEVKKNKKDN